MNNFIYTKQMLYYILILYKIIVMIYSIFYFKEQTTIDTYNTANIIVLSNIVLCIPYDVIVICKNYKEVSFKFCINFCMFLYFTPLIATIFVIDNINNNNINNNIFDIVLITCYFYSLFLLLTYSVIDCFVDIYDEEEKIYDDNVVYINVTDENSIKIM